MIFSRKQPIRQLDREDCGAACLAAVAAHYGLHLPVTRIREIAGTDSDGTTLKGLNDAALHWGFEARAFKSPERRTEDLKGLPLPAILHLVQANGWLHFVVLKSIRSGRFHIWDPADGRMHTYTAETLAQTWSGYLLLLSPGPGFERSNLKISLGERIWKLLRMHRHEWLPALYGSVAYAVAGLTLSLFPQIIIDQVLLNQEYPFLFLIGSFMLVLVILSWITAYYKSLFVIRSGIHMDGGLVLSYVRHLFQLPASFFNRRSSGELNARIGDAFRIRAFVSGQLLVLFISLISLISSFTLLIIFSRRLALITFAFIPGYLLLYKLAKRSFASLNRKMIESAAQFEATSQEAIARVRIAKLFGAEETFLQRIERSYARMAERLYLSGKQNCNISALSEGWSQLQTWTILVAGSCMVLQQQLTVGELISFYSLSQFFTLPVLHLIESTQSLSEARIAADRLYEIQELPAEDQGQHLDLVLEDFQALHIRHLHYEYPGRMPIIHDLNCSFPKGSISAITGKSGCGKSTLAALLLRMLTPNHGCICMDDTNIQFINLKQWRTFISIVPQHSEMFQGTLLENLAPHETHPDLTKIQRLCHQLNLDEWLNGLKDYLLNPIEEGGNNLSGGERQKLALIRALYRDPRILILDEAHVHLDKTDRKNWQQLLRNLADQGKCIILISHEPTLIQWCDQVLDLEQLMRVNRVDDYAPEPVVAI